MHLPHSTTILSVADELCRRLDDSGLVSLVGPWGSGKTTALRAFLRDDRWRGGTVVYANSFGNSPTLVVGGAELFLETQGSADLEGVMDRLAGPVVVVFDDGATAALVGMLSAYGAGAVRWLGSLLERAKVVVTARPLVWSKLMRHWKQLAGLGVPDLPQPVTMPALTAEAAVGVLTSELDLPSATAAAIVERIGTRYGYLRIAVREVERLRAFAADALTLATVPGYVHRWFIEDRADYFDKQRVFWTGPQVSASDYEAALDALIGRAALSPEQRAILVALEVVDADDEIIDPLFVAWHQIRGKSAKPPAKPKTVAPVLAAEPALYPRYTKALGLAQLAWWTEHESTSRRDDGRPAVIGDFVIDAGVHHARCFGVTDGAWRWDARLPPVSAPSSSVIPGDPIVADGVVIVPTDRYVVAIEISTGIVRWRIKTGSTCVVAHEGLLFVGTAKGVASYDLATGKKTKVAGLPAAAEVHSLAATVDGFLIASASGLARLVIRNANAEVAWQHRVRVRCLGSVDGANAWALAAPGLFDATSGEKRWTVSGDLEFGTAAATPDGMAVLTQSTSDDGTQTQQLHWLDVEGNRRWTSNTPIESQFVVARNRIIGLTMSASSGGPRGLVSHELDTGELSSIFGLPELPRRPIESLSVSSDRLFGRTGDGQLICWTLGS